MKNKNGVVPVAIIGVIAIAFSLVAFFLLNAERVAVHWWALAFLLLSEVIMFGGLIGLRHTTANHSSVFLKIGITTSLSLYFGITLVSVLLAGLFRDNLNVFILIELAIIALFAIVSISIFAVARKLERQGEKDIKKIGGNEPKRGGF